MAPLATLLTNRIDALNVARAAKPRPHGTPAETELLDSIDGLIVELCRLARKAGRALARETSQPAIAKEFELDALYRSTGRKKESKES